MAVVVGLLLCAAACLAGEVAKPRLVRTPKQRPARVRITPAGDADAAPPAANASDDDARRRLRDRITNPPTSVPTITYSGVLEAPLILPPSGAVDAAVGITFLHELGPGVVVHCTTDGSEPDRWSTKYLSGGMIHMSGTQHPTLTLRCLARAPERLDEEYRDSAIVTRTYEVQMGTYDYDRSGYTGRVGMAFLVPYYRGQNYIDTTVDYAPAPSGHSAKLPSVDLNTSTYKSVRIHGVETDFAEYYTYDYKGEAADVVYKGKFVPATLQYQRGTGAYDGQVRLHDMAAYANDTMLRGFFHGFVQEHARRNSTERKAISMHYHRRFLVSEDELAVAVAKFGCSPSDRRDPVHNVSNAQFPALGVGVEGHARRRELRRRQPADEVRELLVARRARRVAVAAVVARVARRRQGHVRDGPRPGRARLVVAPQVRQQLREVRRAARRRAPLARDVERHERVLEEAGHDEVDAPAEVGVEPDGPRHVGDLHAVLDLADHDEQTQRAQADARRRRVAVHDEGAPRDDHEGRHGREDVREEVVAPPLDDELELRESVFEPRGRPREAPVERLDRGLEHERRAVDDEPLPGPPEAPARRQRAGLRVEGQAAVVELARERARRRRRRGHGAVARERRGGGVAGLRLRAARRDLVRPVEVRVPEPSELVGREVDGVETAAGAEVREREARVAPPVGEDARRVEGLGRLVELGDGRERRGEVDQFVGDVRAAHRSRVRRRVGRRGGEHGARRADGLVVGALRQGVHELRHGAPGRRAGVGGGRFGQGDEPERSMARHRRARRLRVVVAALCARAVGLPMRC